MTKKLYFITPTLMKVLELFLEDPMEEFYERESVRKTHVSKGSANKLLRLLTKLDFLIREKKGRMVFYKLNTKEPTVRQFKVFLNVFTLKNILDKIKNKCRKIIIFGSCSIGTDVKESDIDLFVMTSEKNSIKDAISMYNKRAKRKISPIIVDANEFIELKNKDEPLYENIDKGIVLWETE